MLLVAGNNNNVPVTDFCAVDSSPSASTSAMEEPAEDVVREHHEVEEENKSFDAGRRQFFLLKEGSDVGSEEQLTADSPKASTSPAAMDTGKSESDDAAAKGFSSPARKIAECSDEDGAPSEDEPSDLNVENGNMEQNHSGMETDSPPPLSPSGECLPFNQRNQREVSKSNSAVSLKDKPSEETDDSRSGTDSSPPPDPTPTSERTSERQEEENGSADLSDVEFLDEVPRQVQNRPETAATTSLTVPMTVDAFRDRFADLVKKEARINKAGHEQKLTALLAKFIQQESVISPLGVRKIVEGEEFTNPVNVCLPPSQVVHLMAEYDPSEQLRSLIDDIFGADAASPDSMAERKHKQEFRMQYPTPNITRVLYDIGLQLAQETTYSDIVKMKNLPSEMPRKPDTITKVVAQVKPYLEMLKTQTGPYKLQMERCNKCSYKTESALVMDKHKQFPHFREKTGYWDCGFCPDFGTRKKDEIVDHYETEHGCDALFELPPAKAPCSFCNEEFLYKGVLQQHLKNCKRQMKHRYILSVTDEDRLTANRWLWPKPADLPSSGVTTGVRVLQLNPSQPGVQFITASGIQGGAVLRLQNQGRGNLRVPPGMTNQIQIQQQMRRTPNILPKSVTVRNVPGLSTSVNPLQQRQPIVVQQQQNRLVPQMGARSSVQIINNRPVAAVDVCEICDSPMGSRDKYFEHLQSFHKRITNKTRSDFMGGAPLACSRCKERFWTYEGLERHLVMTHGLVTSDLLQKAQSKLDSGRCTFCNKQYAFNLLQHLVMDHKKKLCSAEILYSCDVCTYQCTSYTDLERHLNVEHGNMTQAAKRPFSGLVSGPAPKIMRPAPAPVEDVSAQRTRVVNSNEAQKKGAKIRYTCTPCSLKFSAYNEVITHWQEKHLAKVSPHTCRVDQCQRCAEDFEKQGIKPDFSPPLVPNAEEVAPETDIICLD